MNEAFNTNNARRSHLLSLLFLLSPPDSKKHTIMKSDLSFFFLVISSVVMSLAFFFSVFTPPPVAHTHTQSQTMWPALTHGRMPIFWNTLGICHKIMEPHYAEWHSEMPPYIPKVFRNISITLGKIFTLMTYSCKNCGMRHKTVNGLNAHRRWCI